MADSSLSIEFFIYILDLFGTMAFAVTGAFKAIEHKADIVGIIILATITGVAGGTIRDVILGKDLPNSLIDPSYVIITVVSAIVIFLLHSKMKKHWNIFLKFDAIGLGVFTVIGATFAYNMFGMNFLVIVLSGMLTAIGGGILRDVFVSQTPIVFVKELYASASFLGAAVFYLVILLTNDVYAGTISGLLLATGLRMVAMKYNWNLPKVKSN
ncbi:MAG: trimeric intracellular cation channel family protein [Candidatus Nitrosopelagicus sp.]|nr:trimeric intracellular cation channel family protein [Candidatus Nitrosopelagicus sp.]MBT6369978.1 trimeric intracellular cation channel family protein [Nitrososphaerota archaeon]MBT3762256.1 trimeric intracellular cation channel family protein [Candidatus Nitrosopelagicus sp.]MBT4454674.1 trimeric intracellular cation channel family protein [Candidatus Nitrosopelagicus sp.]MBT5171906.1 trimeric intracellular cation channel family protein [Candidatus Nitrosopelagicus sp.]